MAMYRVPKNEQRQYERLVSRANSRIRANMQYIQEENITSDSVKRSLLGDYVDRGAWASEKATFHDRVIFESEKDYRQYKREVAKWGGVETGRKVKNRYEIETPEASVEGRKEGYYQAIIESLTRSAIENGVEMDGDKLPGNIGKKIKSLTLEQMRNFFDNDDAVADLEYLPYSEVDFNGVTTEEFVEKVDSIVDSLKEVHPNANGKAYKEMIDAGIDSKTALKTIFPEATPHQLGYYGRGIRYIPAEYKPPRRRKKKKK